MNNFNNKSFTNASFDEKLQDFIHNMSNYKYIFEVTKVCGYSELFIIYKDNTLLDLYKNVSLQFNCHDIKKLYMKNTSTMENINIPITEKMTVRNFIVENNCFLPIYNLPSPTVYRIYFEDESCYHSCHDYC